MTPSTLYIVPNVFQTGTKSHPGTRNGLEASHAILRAALIFAAEEIKKRGDFGRDAKVLKVLRRVLRKERLVAKQYRGHRLDG